MGVMTKRWLLGVALLQLYFGAVLVQADGFYGTFLIDKKFCSFSNDSRTANCSGINIEGHNYSQYKFYFDQQFYNVRFEDSVIQKMPTGIRCERCYQFEMVNCSLEVLRLEDFSQWRELGRINLSHNKLSYLPDGLFSTLPYASNFDISYNNLSTLPAVLFPETRRLTINVSHNRMGAVSNNTFRGVTALNLSYNNLTGTSLQFLSNMKGLLSLDLSGNCLGDIPLPTFAANANLTQLKLNDTCITDIKYGTFPQISLKELDLSNNRLLNLDYLKLYQVRFLEKLYLDNTYVSEYNIDNIISKFPIREIGLEGDRHQCTTLIRWLKTERILVFHVDPDKAVWNRPNINGVACIEKN